MFFLFPQIYAIKTESYSRSPNNLYFTLIFTAFTLMAATIVGIAVIRRRNARLPQNQVSIPTYFHALYRFIALYMKFKSIVRLLTNL